MSVPVQKSSGRQDTDFAPISITNLRLRNPFLPFLSTAKAKSRENHLGQILHAMIVVRQNTPPRIHAKPSRIIRLFVGNAGRSIPDRVFSPQFVLELSAERLEAVTREDITSIEQRKSVEKEVQSLTEGRRILTG